MSVSTTNASPIDTVGVEVSTDSNVLASERLTETTLALGERAPIIYGFPLIILGAPVFAPANPQSASAATIHR